ncbi:MAG: BatD family protein [Pseudoxanthomonas sp.]
MRFRHSALHALLLAGSLLASAHAATRAWLDRNPVNMGEAVTLNIETDQVAARPDFSPLQADFEIADQSSSRQLQFTNGVRETKTLYAVGLLPKRAGKIGIPALRVGAESTPPLSVTVRAVAAPAVVDPDADTVVETEVDGPNPYVQQTVGVTLRLYYAMALASGQLDLDAPVGASLQRVGDDVQSVRERNGRRYNVVERHFLLVPDRSGPLVLPAPRFAGRGVGGWIDDLLGGNSREIRAIGAPRTLQVRPQPANAPQPWLPLRDLRLRYVSAPQEIRAGEAATLTVELTAEGATRSQLPDLPLPSAPGAQVFAEPPQFDETFRDGAPQVRMLRKYSLVPDGSGTLRVAGIRAAWWDVRADAAKNAVLPDLEVKVMPGGGGSANRQLPAAPSAAIATDAPTPANAAPARIPARTWAWLAAMFAVLWLATLVWALWRRQSGAMRAAGEPGTRTRRAALPTRSLPDLRKALDTGTLDEIGEILCAMAAPPAPDLDALIARLADAGQRDAVEAMRRARWADGDGPAARALARTAFRNGPLWRDGNAGGKRREPILPPLYPGRRGSGEE